MEGPSDEELLAEVYAHPDDLERRLVYADRLLERGDPRGEFIALQCRRSGDKRVAQLLREHGGEWRKPLASVIYWGPKQLKWEAGFISEVELRCTERQLEPLLGHPMWSTVKVLRLLPERRGRPAGVKLLMDPALRSLREVRGQLVLAELVELARVDRDLAIEALELDLRASDALGTVWTTVAESRALGRLRRLNLVVSACTPAQLAAFFAGGLAERMDSLAVECPTWRLQLSGSVLWLTHTGPSVGRDAAVKAFLALLDALPPRSLTGLHVIVWWSGFQDKQAALEAFRKAGARFERMEKVEVY